MQHCWVSRWDKGMNPEPIKICHLDQSHKQKYNLEGFFHSVPRSFDLHCSSWFTPHWSIHTNIGLTGVIKEALMLSFLLIPGKTPALICFFCRHLCTTSLRLLDAWNASYASGSRASKLKQQHQGQWWW